MDFGHDSIQWRSQHRTNEAAALPNSETAVHSSTITLFGISTFQLERQNVKVTDVLKRIKEKEPRFYREIARQKLAYAGHVAY